ncbi:hypothetical protein [Natronorubrum tibetense]|uniref:Uncharacterized protein n=1 Tax=Natronorubrum tibetense GA33 TaxID=1114856 RepID=L9VJR9_9EURY|nr:hypothetical protein [Natronorubrum tibetense]ELY37445.1 hypothetical protein C496_20195 [Natronorubrum tibetense GA33]
MSQWIVRNIVLSFVLWAVFAYVAIACFELFVLGRFERTRYLPAAIGMGIGFTFGVPLLPIRSADST